MSSLVLRKAARQQTKIRIGISGPSGSGKTYSALLLASGMAPWEKIAVIDTENGSADLYSHLGPYSVITLAAPFSPERYIEAIEACAKAGIEVIVIDSVSHEWDGKGGCLESNDLLAHTSFKGNTWAAWNKTTPRHQKFIAAILQSPCHVITTARAKTETVQTEDKKVKKVGMKEIQRDGFEYELTINLTLDRDGHYATASKDRTGMFSEIDPFRITPETGVKILEWAKLGTEPVAPAQEHPPEVPAAPADVPAPAAKPTAPKEPLPPTKTAVMEAMNAEKDKAKFAGIYDGAFRFPWSEADARDLGECYVSGICRFNKWVTNGTKTQLFNAAGEHVMDVVKDERTGKVGLKKVTPAEKAMAEAEEAGKAADSASAA